MECAMIEPESGVQINVIIALIWYFSSSKRAPLILLKVMFYIRQSFGSVATLQLVEQTQRRLFGLFARNSLYDVLIGLNCMGDWQPGIFYYPHGCGSDKLVKRSRRRVSDSQLYVTASWRRRYFNLAEVLFEIERKNMSSVSSAKLRSKDRPPSR